ncbi:hypothetical protein FJR45_05870 [Sulfurimonas sediminis]|uniref:Alginate export domain-containing protein n=1 Tax=Sulfurimonas sediminis TaxID=2590020 RepID=A0A7M1B1A9_9BACT|nr:hypothetical protein [Sulfurimonas sediminis]QOP43504.1 hypothetical protein FJR45_05870 [Sulfurimonas sediminis]
MKKLLLSMAALPLVIGGLSVSASADGINILDNIKLKGQIRPRFESVDDGTTNANANAYTVRTKLSVTADLLGVDGLSATVGIISVNNLGSHEYNAGDGTVYTDGSGNPYATVVDPQKAMIANAEVNYTIEDTLLHVGRNQINLDNQRFIGTVGWRQLERSYDSVFVANNSIKNLSLLAAWVYGIQGVGSKPLPYQGPFSENTYDTNTVILHAAYTVMPELKVTAYDYMIAGAHDTYGIALTGKVKTDMAKLSYRAEYALQKDSTMEIHNSNGKADASYYNLDLGANVNGILAGVNYEFLSGTTGTDGKTNFNPMLGTNHKFNGWADVFYVGNSGPLGGLKDFNVRLGYTAKGLGKLLAVYHTFTADKTMGGLDDLGSEFDAVYTNKIPGVNNLTGLLKYADYSKGTVTGYTNDIQKIWVGLDYKFATK